MHTIHRKDLARGFAGLAVLLLSHAAYSSDTPVPEPGAAPEPAVRAQFTPLFTVGKGSGAFLIKRPSCEFEAGVASRAYPYGSEIIVQKGAKVFVFLSGRRQVHFFEGSRFRLIDDPEVAGGKRIVLTQGSLETLLANDEDEVYPLVVETEAAKFEDFDGRVTVLAESDPAYFKAATKIIIGKVTVSAPQLKPSRIGTGAGFAIRTKGDLSYTELKGSSGDFKVLLEQGSAAPFEAEFHSGSLAKIWRKWAPLNKRLAVSVMLAGSDGAVAKSYAFIEGQPPVQNGVRQDTGMAEPAAGEEAPADAGGDAGGDAGDDLGDDFSSDASLDFGSNTGDSSFGNDLPSFDSFSF